MHGILIDIEGADGSGKTEQAKRLFERLKAEGYPVTFFDFPQYSGSHTGKLIGELLAGKHGDFMSMPAYVSALPYAVDRGVARDAILEALECGSIVSNRYTPSNLAHQSAKLPKDEQPALVDFIEKLEYEDLKLPRPDLVIYLSVPTDVSTELIMQKEKRDYLGETETRDLAERNIAHQDRARAAYLRLVKEKGWHVVDCAPQGTMRSREDIHEEVSRIVHEKLAV